MINVNALLLIDDIKKKINTLFKFDISRSFLSSIIRNKYCMTRKQVRFYGKKRRK